MAKRRNETQENGGGVETLDEPKISLEFDFVPPRPGTCKAQVDLRHMTLTQIRGLHFLASSLDKSGATLERGNRRVGNGVDAIRWICEQIGKQLPEDWKPDRYRPSEASESSESK